METKVTTLACLFVSKRNHLAVRLIEPPVPEIPGAGDYPGFQHAVRVLGMTDQIRTFKRVVEGVLPVYEEI